MTDTAAAPTADQVDRYLLHLARDLGRSPATIVGYRRELELLVGRAVLLRRAELSRFIAEKQDGSSLAPQTRNRRLAILRGFLAFLREERELQGDPLEGLKRIRLPPQAIVATTFEELDRALGVLGRRAFSWRRVRDGAVIVVLFYTGLRVSELVRLDLGQLDLQAATLRRVLRKGGRVEEVALHPVAVQALELYLDVRPTTNSAAVFLASHFERTGKRSIQKNLARLGQRAGLGNRLHPHALRHACATELAAANVSSTLIQRHMAHRSLQTTERYIHLLPAPVRLAVAHLPTVDLAALLPPGASRTPVPRPRRARKN